MTDTHPLWRPFSLVTPEEIAQARVGEGPVGPVAVVPPDPGGRQRTSGSPGSCATSSATG